MAFNPANYKVKEAKKLPVILLLDVSGSMSGEKIETLQESVETMIKDFAGTKLREIEILVSIITFGSSVNLHTQYTPVKKLVNIELERFIAQGMTPLGTALRMAKDMIEDRDVTQSKNVYRPTVVLVSDGEPTDDWENNLDNFISNGRSSKTQRFSIAIGDDANTNVLEKFVDDSSNLLLAKDVKDISDKFNFISMSVSRRAVSQNPNIISENKADNNQSSNQFNNNLDDDEYI